VSLTTCPHCDYTGNPAYATTCMQCRLELPRSNPQPVSTLPQYKQKQKMAVFDLDKTLFDLSRRERVAKRAGHNLDTPAAWAEMNKPQHISKDEPIAGTVQFVNDLAKDGYVIAYLSGRPNNLMGPTREHLQRSGYPVHKGTETDLIFLAPVPARYDPSMHFQRIVSYKKDILTRLSSQYDLTFYFDDSQEFRNAARSIRPRIPAVYASVADYTGNRAYAPRADREEKAAAANPGRSDEVFHLPAIPTLSKAESSRLTSAAKQAYKTMKVEMKAFQMDVPGDDWTKLSDAELPDTNPRKTGASATRAIEFKDMIEHKIDAPDHRDVEPFGYSMNLLKRIKSYNHEGREYMGLLDAKTKKLHVGTGFGVGSVGPADSVINYIYDNDVPVMFHTHPTRRNDFGWIKGFDWFNPSLPDHGFTMWMYLFGGVGTHIVSQKKGVHFLRPYIRPRSRLATLVKKKKLTKKEKEEVVKLLKADFTAISKLYRTFWKRMVENGMGGAQMMDLEQAGDITTAIVNSDLKSMKFQHDYFTYPLMAVQYKGTEDGWEGEYKGIRSNPVSRPRKKRASDGNMKREPAKQYFDRLMSELYKEFPDNSQRAAVALSYVEKEYGQRGVNLVTKTWAKNNPGEGEKVNLLPIYSGAPTQTYKSLGMVTSVVQVGRNVIKDIKEGIQDIYRGLVGGRQSLTEKRMMMSVLLMHSDLSEATLALGGNAICNLKIDYEIPSYQGNSRMDITLIATADAIKMGRGTVKSNPGGATVEQAKKMYKQFHQTEPNSVTKKKVDFGDTWVGLGKAWSIGYRSPKETGSKEQKYIHHFGKDEDTGKTYKEPELYYVENKDGTKMMVIMGGDWYIDVDSDGEVSWIYI